MSKEVKELSPLKRGLWIFGLVFVGGALFGIAMGFFAGLFNGYFDEAGYNFDTVKEAVLWISRSAAAILLLATLYKMIQTKRFHADYLATDEDDEDLVDNYYRATFRSLEMGTVFYNISATLVVFSLVLSQYLSLSSDGGRACRFWAGVSLSHGIGYHAGCSDETNSKDPQLQAVCFCNG